MTTPDVPHRITFSVEVPGTPEQVWAAIATTDGISSWFVPTDVDPHEGGAIVVHMGETDSSGTVTGWDPPRRLAYEEPDWAALGGHPEAAVTPLVSEFLVDAQSGGTCVVRVVSSAFGTGADWEHEGFEQMARHWVPYFEHQLRMYLGRFPGQRATTLDAQIDVPAPGEVVQQAIEHDLGATEVGRVVDLLGAVGRVERAGDPYVVVSLTDPVPGYMSFFAMDNGDGSAHVQVGGWLFGDGARAFVETAAPAWRSWAEGLVVPRTSGAPR
jgi:uncharacterized protein YndB with AHSA1/START domain